MKYEIYTDGSMQSSINGGGYAAVITSENKIIKVIYNGFTNTTNNRMELMGIIAALNFIQKEDSAIIYSDSQYVLNNIRWAEIWIAGEDNTKKNLDLWKKLLTSLEGKNVEFIWVKGHNDNKFNEIADKYAVHAAQCLNLPSDL